MKYSILNTVSRILVSVALFWVFGSCAISKKTVESEPEEAVAEAATPPSVESNTEAKPQESAPFVHTVRWPGESLSLIAKWYTGGYSNWRKIADANPKLDPNLIRIGDKIVIPQEILKTKKPMEKDFIPSLQKKPETEKPEEHLREPDRTELFEPESR